MESLSSMSEIERDILKEIVNIGLARAADAFAVIAKDRVFLNVPAIRIVEANKVFSLIDGATDNEHITVLQSDIGGDLNGKTYLVFDQHQVARLADVCLGIKVSENLASKDEQLMDSLLLEISNILTGSVLTQFANLLDLHVYGMPPKPPTHDIYGALKSVIFDFPVYKPLILTVQTQFLNSGRLVEFPLLIVFDAGSLEKMINTIRLRQSEGNSLLTKVVS